MKRFYSLQHHKNNGFTLIETLVSVAIITLAILGPLTVAITSASYAKNSKDVIVATYLAHEGIELVRYERDAIYVECQSSVTTCATNVFGAGGIELPEQAAWRIFKERMGSAVSSVAGLQPSCFSSDNAAGCAFDVYDMISAVADVPSRFTGSDDRCATLYTDNRIDQLPTPSPVNGVGVTDHIYLCGEKGMTYGYDVSGYKRVVKLTSLYLDIADQYQKDYEDDVRVESTVTYTRNMGLTRTIKAIDYLHARP
jgi:prepilin-type N-terminal cleavage/methylation domain-containing protein